MTAFTRGFRLHTADGRVLDGAAFPSGRGVVIDDPERGLAAAVADLDALHERFPGHRIEWAGDDGAGA